MEKKFWSSPYGVWTMPFPTEARKCSHLATGGLLEFASKFNGTYMHMKWSFNSERNVSLENVVWEKWKTLPKLYSFFEVHY